MARAPAREGVASDAAGGAAMGRIRRGSRGKGDLRESGGTLQRDRLSAEGRHFGDGLVRVSAAGKCRAGARRVEPIDDAGSRVRGASELRASVRRLAPAGGGDGGAVQAAAADARGRGIAQAGWLSAREGPAAELGTLHHGAALAGAVRAGGAGRDGRFRGWSRGAGGALSNARRRDAGGDFRISDAAGWRASTRPSSGNSRDGR